MRSPRQFVRDVRASDPTGFARESAIRCAVGMTLAFVVGDVAFDNPQTALFAAFGSFAVLVLVDFVGPDALRRRAYGALALAGYVLIPLGTVCSERPAVAAAVMALVAFVVLFSGLVNGYLAAASTAVLLLFVLPVMVPAPPSDIPDRLLGWTIACVVGLTAVAVLWPERPHGKLRRTSAQCCRALAEVIGGPERAGAAPGADAADAAWAKLETVFGQLRQQFFATAYRPTGPTGAAAALGALLEELGWTHANAASPAARAALAGGGSTAADRELRAVTAQTLRRSADRLEDDTAELDATPLERARAVHFAELVDTVAQPDGAASDEALWAALHRSFALRVLAYGADQVALHAVEVTRARTPFSPLALSGDVADTSRLLSAHATMRSVWLRNSVRAAAGLGLAVLAGQLLSVQHAFWVVLGTLSVLRSSALNTGATVVQAMAGTVVGIVIGGALVIAIGTHEGLLWAALPVSVFLASYAPRVVSFAAGQAAFSIVVLVLFNLLAPAGWRVGLVRVEDVAIGAGISLFVGVLFWPRGAGAVVRANLGAAYAACAAYAARALEHRLSQSSPGPDEALRADAVRVTARLDATVRQYLSERTVDEDFVHRIGALAVGPTRLRVVGDVVTDIRHGVPDGAPVPEAAAVLLHEVEHMRRWYTEFGQALARRRDPPPLQAPPADHRAIVLAAVREAVATGDRDRVVQALVVVFDRFHLEQLWQMENRLTRRLATTLPLDDAE